MKKFLQIALTVATMATVAWSCYKNPVDDTMKADNSYVWNKINTPLVWAGVQNYEVSYTIYLASAVPVSTETPITIEGLTITFPAAQLGEELNLGEHSTSALLNDAALTGGKIKVSIYGNNLNVDITGAKVGDNKIDVNYANTFVEIEGEVIPPTPLHNEFRYNDVRTNVNWAYIVEEAGPDWDDWYIELAYGDDLSSGYIALEDTPFLGLTFPKAKSGETVTLTLNASETDYWIIDAFPINGSDEEYYGREVDMDNIVGGTVQYTWNETTEILTVDALIYFTDGTIFEVNYSGVAVVGGGTQPGGENYWEYNSVKYDIDAAETEYDDQNEGSGMGTFVLYNTDGDKAVVLFMPLIMLNGETINLTRGSSYPWQVTYYGNGFTTATQEDWSTQSTAGNLTSGTVKVTFNKTAKTLIVDADIVYSGSTHLIVKYNGAIIVPTPPDPNVPDVLTVNWCGYHYDSSYKANEYGFLTTAITTGFVTGQKPSLAISVPDELMGTTINLATHSNPTTRDAWYINYVLADGSKTYFGTEATSNTVVKSGSLSVTKSGSNVVATWDITFSDDRRLLGANYSGAATNYNNIWNWSSGAPAAAKRFTPVVSKPNTKFAK